MSNTVYALNNDRSWKAALLQPDALLLLQSHHTDAAQFLQAYHTSGFKKWLTTKKAIALADITRLSHPVLSAKKLRIKHGSSTTILEFTSPGEPESLAKAIAAVKGWHGHTAPISKWRAVATLIPGFIITAIAGWLMYGFATSRLDSRGSTGRNKAVALLLQKLAQFLGPELVIGITAAVLGLLTYLIIRRLNNQQEELVYE